MALEVALEWNRDAVGNAVVQFAARRGYRLRSSHSGNAWRIETEQSAGGGRPVRVDVTLRWRLGRTILSGRTDGTAQSMQLFGELTSFLSDRRVYDGPPPAHCPQCGTAVANIRASYCGRCGAKLGREPERCPEPANQ